MSPSNEHNGYNGRAVDWHYGDKIGTVAVIPAYNEERFIGSVVIKACKYADAVIVVDDGSSDATAEIARLAGATVVQHEQNAGKGAALSTGLRKARELHPAAVVVLDADYQHRPREIGQVTAPVLAGEADIVIGSRYLSNGSNTPTHRVWGHRVFNLMTNGASGVAVSDSQSGFRAFSPAALEAIAFRSNGFSVESEMQFIAKEQGLRMVEVPIVNTSYDKSWWLAPAYAKTEPTGNASRPEPATAPQSPTASVAPHQAGNVAGVATVETTIVIPAYNEEEALPHVLSAVLGVVDDTFEIIVVDDGSSDGTRTVVEAFPCRVISHPQNRGKGAAMQTGILAARGRKVIFTDGDATYPVDVIPAISAHLDEVDLVRCVRENGRDHMPVINRLGNLVIDRAIRTMHRIDGGDILTGLYGLRRRTLLDMRLQSDGFDIETEIVVKAGAMRLQSHCIPIHYNERIGEKKLSPVRDGVKIMGRAVLLAAMYNPFVMYVLPGLVLWLLALGALIVLGRGPVLTSIAGLTTNTYIVGAMAFLAGFQLVVFGMVVNTYAAETGLGIPSRSLYWIARRVPRVAGACASIVLILGGLLWAILLAGSWVRAGFSAFQGTESLVAALALVVWGVQLLCTMFFLSLFSGNSKLTAPFATSHARHNPSPA